MGGVHRNSGSGVRQRVPHIINQTPTNPTLIVATTSPINLITPSHPDTRVIDETFVMANFSQLEPLMRTRVMELRMDGLKAQLEYSSEEYDEEMKMEAPSGFQMQVRQPLTNQIK
ncbi:hypothetical protein Tco_1251429, partial [Tanacetum coccineum]